MKTKSVTIWIMVVVLCLASSQAMALVEFKDGGIHNIDYEMKDDVWVDHQILEMQTTVNLLPGGQIWRLIAHWSSRVTMSGGTIDTELIAFRSSQITVSGGQIGDLLYAEDDSQVAFTGGSIGWLYTINNSQVTVSGGQIGGNIFAGYDTGDDNQITFLGRDFAVNGVPFGYGELKSILAGTPYDEPARHLTGILASGEPLDNDFYIGGNAKIVLAIPEPATLFLLGFGVVFLRRLSFT